MKGFTLIEVVVALGIFTVLAVVSSTLMFSILRGAKKAAAVAAVRTEGEYAMDALTSHLRFARQINSCSASQISFTSVDNTSITFSCQLDPTTKTNYLADSSGRLTSPEVTLVSCNVFTCPSPLPQSQTVQIGYTLTRSGSVAIEGAASVDFSSGVELRNGQ